MDNNLFLFHSGDAISDLVTVKREIETRRLDVVCFKLAIIYYDYELF